MWFAWTYGETAVAANDGDDDFVGDGWLSENFGYKG